MKKSLVSKAGISAVYVVLMMQFLPAQTQKGQTSNIVGSGLSPALCTDTKGALYLVYEAVSEGKKTVAVTSSTDLGRSWTPSKSISGKLERCSKPTVAVERSGAIDVAWSASVSPKDAPDIYFARSTNKGVAWSAPVDVSNTPGKSSLPKLACDMTDKIHVVWSDTSKGALNQDIYYTNSTDHGVTWSKNPLLPAEDISNTPGLSTDPDIIIDSHNTPHVAWTEGIEAEDSNIFWVTKHGSLWTTPQNVSKTVGRSSRPSLACNKNKIYLCWSDNSRKEFAADVWLDTKQDGGRFSKPINVSNTPGVSSQPHAVADRSGRMACVWSDTTRGVNTPHIFGRVSLDDADDFSNVMDLSASPIASTEPHSVLTGKYLITAWTESDGDVHTIHSNALKVDGIATGPAMLVDPAIRGLPANMH